MTKKKQKKKRNIFTGAPKYIHPIWQQHKIFYQSFSYHFIITISIRDHPHTLTRIGTNSSRCYHRRSAFGRMLVADNDQSRLKACLRFDETRKKEKRAFQGISSLHIFSSSLIKNVAFCCCHHSFHPESRHPRPRGSHNFSPNTFSSHDNN